MDITLTILEVFVFAFQLGLVLWVYRAWNRRHEDIQEALQCIENLQRRVGELEGRA